MDMAPRRWRDFLDHGQGLRVSIRLVLCEQPRQDRGIVVNDGVRDQPRTLIADLDFDVGPTGEFLLATNPALNQRSCHQVQLGYFRLTPRKGENKTELIYRGL